MKAAPTYRAYPCRPGIQGAIWNRPEGRGGPWAQKQAQGTYKDPQALKYFISERGKVVPRRISGNCARHQRKVTLAIKRARNIALLPFTVTSA